MKGVIILNIIRKILNLEKQVSTLIQNNAKEKKFINADIEAGKENTSRAQRSADDANEKGSENEESIIAAEQTITDMDLQNIENEQMITDMDLRIMELEGK